MKTKVYLERLNNIVKGGGVARTAEECIADIQGITVKQFEGFSKNRKKSDIQEFKSSISYIRSKLRKMALKLLTPGNGKMRYSIAARENPEHINKQLVKEKKRIVRAVERLDIDREIIETSKYLSQQELLPFKFDKYTKLHDFLEDSYGHNEENKEN